MGLIFASMGGHEKAIECFNTTISLDPNHKDAIFQKGLSLLAKGKLSKSEKMFDNVLESDSKHEGSSST